MSFVILALVIKDIAWPAAVLLLGVFGLLIFRAEIRQLILRVRKAWGFDIDTVRREQQVSATVRTSTPEKLPHPFESIALKENESAIRVDLERRAPADVNERVDFLITHLAAAQLIFSFEIISRTIWGSQIDLLLHVNTQPTGETIGNLRGYYDNASAQAPDHLAQYPFERYLGYLRNQGLVNELGERIHITNFGKEFLAHLARSGATFRRPY